MGIDFRDPTNRRTYSGREADASWRAAVAALVDPVSADVVDIGCGGGTYTRAWHELGAATVTGVDFSAPILAAARESHGDLPGVSFRPGDAAATGLPAGCADVVFERALIHHVPDLAAVAAEAVRLLRPAECSCCRTARPRTSPSRARPTLPGAGSSSSFPVCWRSRTPGDRPWARWSTR